MNALLPGLRHALKLCREVDRKQAKDGLLREPVDCVERIENELRGIEYRRLLTDSNNNPD